MNLWPPDIPLQCWDMNKPPDLWQLFHQPATEPLCHSQTRGCGHQSRYRRHQQFVLGQAIVPNVTGIRTVADFGAAFLSPVAVFGLNIQTFAKH